MVTEIIIWSCTMSKYNYDYEETPAPRKSARLELWDILSIAVYCSRFALAHILFWYFSFPILHWILCRQIRSIRLRRQLLRSRQFCLSRHGPPLRSLWRLRLQLFFQLSHSSLRRHPSRWCLPPKHRRSQQRPKRHSLRMSPTLTAPSSTRNPRATGRVSTEQYWM